MNNHITILIIIITQEVLAKLIKYAIMIIKLTPCWGYKPNTKWMAALRLPQSKKSTISFFNVHNKLFNVCNKFFNLDCCRYLPHHMRRQRAARGENSRDKSADEDDVEGGDDYEDEKS